jgi:hypothetical protein
MAGIIKVDRVQSDSNLAFNVGGSNVSFFNSTGVNIVGGEIIAGGSTLRTTAGLLYANNGISFPATQSSSANGNTLDDYEEGTFTPQLTFADGTVLSSYEANGRYTKVGRLVTISMTMSAVTTGSSGYCTIQNLPFTSAASSIGSFGGDGTTFTGASLQLIMDSGISFVYLSIQAGGTGSLGGWTYSYPGLWSAGGKYMSISYITST